MKMTGANFLNKTGNIILGSLWVKFAVKFIIKKWRISEPKFPKNAQSKISSTEKFQVGDQTPSETKVGSLGCWPSVVVRLSWVDWF